MMKIKEIMLIDDDSPTNFLSSLIIRKKGCCDHVSTFVMATDALENLQSRLDSQQAFPTVILLDLNMPKMNGWQFLEIFDQFDFEKMENKPLIFILSTSMNPDVALRAHGIESVAGLLSKPLNNSMLDSILRMLEQEA